MDAARNAGGVHACPRQGEVVDAARAYGDCVGWVNPLNMQERALAADVLTLPWLASAGNLVVLAIGKSPPRRRFLVFQMRRSPIARYYGVLSVR